MNKQHTPGPWMIYDNRVGYPVVGPDDGDGGPDEREAVAMVFGRSHGASYDDAREQEAANARLIAAAPDLLAALEMVADLPGFAARDYYGVKVLEAIARARGES